MYICNIMLRQIITPSEPTYMLQLPKEMMGKTVEIIAFEIGEQSASTETGNDKLSRIQRIEKLTSDKLVDLSNFKFNRNDANDYDG